MCTFCFSRESRGGRERERGCEKKKSHLFLRVWGALRGGGGASWGLGAAGRQRGVAGATGGGSGARGGGCGGALFLLLFFLFSRQGEIKNKREVFVASPRSFFFLSFSLSLSFFCSHPPSQRTAWRSRLRPWRREEEGFGGREGDCGGAFFVRKEKKEKKKSRAKNRESFCGRRLFFFPFRLFFQS